MAGPTGVVLNTGSGGATLGVDSDGTYDYQIVKLGYSAAGATPTQASATNPLPVAAFLSGTAASVNTGTADAGTLRVVLATNQPSLSNALPVSQSGSWTVTANAGTGTFSISGVLADGGAFTRGTTSEMPVGGIAETSAPSLTTGKAAALSLTLAGALRVDGSGVTQPVSISGNQAVNVAQVGGTATKTGSGTGGAGSLNVYLATDQPSLTNALAVTQSGSWTVTVNSLPAGTNNIGNFALNPVSGLGWPSTYSGSIGATATAIKASAGTLGGWYIGNSNTSAVYVQIFDAATGSVTLGTTAPKMSLFIPAGGAANLELAAGIKFSTAITFACTTTRAGSTAPTNTVDVNFLYA